MNPARNPYARREALWRLGIAAPPVAAGRHGTQLALALELPAAPALDPLGDWDSMLADYRTTGLTTAAHPLALLRPGLAARGTVTSADLGAIGHGSRVRIGGLVVARQRPSTASGICFMLLEDEHGTINLVVPRAVYERHRIAVRTEPLVLADGVLERYATGGGAVNVLVRRLGALDSPDSTRAEVKEFALAGERELERRAADQAAGAETAAAGGGAAGFRAVAPPVMSFAQGRRR